MLNRRNAKKYGDVVTPDRRLGNHMPRIASGDGNEDFEEEAKQEARKSIAETTPIDRPAVKTARIPREDTFPVNKKQDSRRIADDRERTEARLAAEARLNGQSFAPVPIQPNYRRQLPTPLSPTFAAPLSAQELDFPNLSSSEDVAGVPGRLRLSRTTSAPPTPLKTRPISGLWADVQRHLIQAYEYLCHVGEAQQWIEGCLGEELEFGVVEMNEGLRNGVVLARLARVWDPASVRKIFDVCP